jgi:hypothetical protein
MLTAWLVPDFKIGTTLLDALIMSLSSFIGFIAACYYPVLTLTGAVTKTTHKPIDCQRLLLAFSRFADKHAKQICHHHQHKCDHTNG